VIQFLYLPHVFRLFVNIHCCKTAFCALLLYFSALSHVGKCLHVFSKISLYNDTRGEEMVPHCYKYVWLIIYIIPFSRARRVFKLCSKPLEAWVISGVFFLNDCKDFLSHQYIIYFKWIHVIDIYTFKSTPINSLYHNKSSNPYLSFTESLPFPACHTVIN